MTDNEKLRIRIISSFVLVIFSLILLLSNDFVFLVLTQLIIFLANWEILRLLKFKDIGNNFLDYNKSNFLLSRCKISINEFFFIFLISLFIIFFYIDLLFFQLFLSFLIIFQTLKLKLNTYTNIFVLLYLNSAFVFLVLLRLDSNFLNYISFIILFSMIVDISCYSSGKLLGGKKLAINISPNKTISGAIGGIILPFFVCFIIFYKNGNFFEIFFLTLIFSLISQAGDLFESKFKRLCAVKDSSNLIPGHGGILDRLDSIIPLIIFVSIMKLFDYNFFFIV